MIFGAGVGNTCLEETCLEFVCGCVVGFDVYCVVLYSIYVGGYLWGHKYLCSVESLDLSCFLSFGRLETTTDDA